MKKKFLMALTAIVCVICFAVGLVACNNTASEKANAFISVLDGVFASAGYRSSGATGAKAISSEQNVAYAANQSDEETILTNIKSIYGTVKTNDNEGLLDDYNLKYLKCDALYQGANLAALFKSMAQVLGDNVFSTVYDLAKNGMEGTVAKLEANEFYTLYGVGRNGNDLASAIQFGFREYANGKFAFRLAQYSKLNGVSELHFTYYDSESVAFNVTLQGNINADFNTYDENYAAFDEVEYSIAIFENEDYVRDSSKSATVAEAVMKLAKDNLGFDNQTYKNLASISGGKEIGNKDANLIGSKMSENRYINPYMGTNGNMNVTVSNEYRIPADVTEVATASIPATKKLIVPAHVEKILDAPFKYPQFVEEIVFEDPDNGALVQIGNDDIVEYYDNGELWFRDNTSRHFLISYTKVKNFTLPKTVKKIEGPIYITTDMEVLDLSAYHPDYTLEEDEKGKDEKDKEGYKVSLYTSVFNRTSKFYKELGSVEKLYVNGDYTLRFFGDNDMRDIYFGDYLNNGDINSIKLDIYEYIAYNKTEDKNYVYTPTGDIYMSIFAMLASGEYEGQTFDYGEYRGYTKVDNLIDELIVTDVNEKLDLSSDLFKKVSITADVSDFAKIYSLLNNSETDKEFSFTLIQNGQPKTVISFLSADGENTALDERMYVKTPSGETFISQLKYKQEFYAPSAMESTVFGDSGKLYFVGWSFTPNAEKADVYEGDKVVNYYQNMYAVYAPVTNGIDYIDNCDNTVTAKIDGVQADIIVIPDTYEGKRVEGLRLLDYTGKKIILPDSIGVANSAILMAIANNVVDGLKSITRFSDIEDGIDWLYKGNNANLIEKLKHCNSAVYDNGLYYLKNNASNYFMLIGADKDLSGQVFISNQCSIIAGVEFGDGVTDIVMNGYNPRLKYIGYMKFNSVSSFSIPSCVVQIEYIAGTVTRNFSFPFGNDCKINVFEEAFKDFHVDGVWLDITVFEEESLKMLADIFNNNTKLYLQCEYKDIADCNFYRVSYNMYFFSETEPDFDDEDIGEYNYWHYNASFNMTIWER